MGEINPELREKLKPCVEEFIIFLEEMGEQPPKTEIHVPSNSKGIEKRRVKDFANIANDYTDDDEGIFEDVAEWLVDSGSGYKKEYRFDSKQDLINEYVKDFVYLSSNVMDYTGEFSMEEKEYNIVFDTKMGREYGKAIPYKKICPIKGIEFGNDDITLSNQVHIVEDDNKNSSVSIEISPLSLEEKCAIYSFAQPNSFGIGNSGYLNHGTTYAIKTKMKGDWISNLGGELCKMVITALKLHKPEISKIGRGDVFSFSPNGVSYREDIELVRGVTHQGDTQQVFETTTIEGVKEFKRFWKNYGSYCYTEGVSAHLR